MYRISRGEGMGVRQLYWYLVLHSHKCSLLMLIILKNKKQNATTKLSFLSRHRRQQKIKDFFLRDDRLHLFLQVLIMCPVRMKNFVIMKESFFRLPVRSLVTSQVIIHPLVWE